MRTAGRMDICDRQLLVTLPRRPTTNQSRTRPKSRSTECWQNKATMPSTWQALKGLVYLTKQELDARDLLRLLAQDLRSQGQLRFFKERLAEF